MEIDIAFNIDVQDYSVHQLMREDVKAIQLLYEKCLDFLLLVDGHPPGKNAAEEEFQNIPPGRSEDDKFIFGIVDPLNELIGVLDVISCYPNEATWWIGLLLLVPNFRSQDIGKKVIKGFIEYVKVSGGKAIMLGVVEENEHAFRFWSKMGFEFIRETEPKQFGNKTHAVRIMRQKLQD
jgi:GNAT superfamily N-acetyltransferase